MTPSSQRRRTVVLDVVGLTPRLLAHMPALRTVAAEGFTAAMGTVFPALTCPVQSSILTGAMPDEHGIVANGWFFRDAGEIFHWRQSNSLVRGDKLWSAGRRRDPGYRVGNICWWYAMGMDIDVTVTPRPVYHHDGRKSQDCYAHPQSVHDELTAALGPFPLFSYWGPGAGIASTRWIVGAAGHVLDTRAPDTLLVYIPHLDYELQRHGPEGPQARAAARAVDDELAPLLRRLRAEGTTVVALSEYGITAARRPVDVNRALRREGLLNVHVQQDMENLDPWTSPAFAVADHQVAHLYVRDPADISRVRDVVTSLPGVDRVLDRGEQAQLRIGHERSGELVAIAEPDAWFTYYYWLDDDLAPDFATGVDIFRKAGYDPAELFFDPTDPTVKLRAAMSVAKLKLGIRTSLQVVGLDPSCVRGSHGRLPDDPRDGPLLICSDPAYGREHYHVTEVRDLLLRLAGLGSPG
ncbi:alkaline phosphatase family protein [Streptomyces sp. NPDC049040]|uniref:alkaline phosphatase family protein n=1 Tax=Streptomyces sp. NPDC049040 TaxID=3365593 RepID=UPI00372490AB